jgi:DNA-binding transcriptional MerR regulator
VGRYTVGDVAERSGFSASALRYYEGIGLVEPVSRSSGGYRIYDDDVLARLAFIARAKQLGCSLQEITDLASIRDGQQCGPVQRRLHDLVTDKIGTAEAQIVELRAFADQLRQAAEQLSGEPVDGPCDAECACAGPSPESTVMATCPVAWGSPSIDVPIACTLGAGAMTQRVDEWAAVLATARRRLALGDGGLRVEFGADVDVAELARLAVAEQQCCEFFSFALTVDSRGTALEIAAPEGADGIVTDLFGAAL